MRSRLLLALILVLVAAPAAAARPLTLGGWDRHEQRVVARAGLMTSGHGAASLSGAALRRAVSRLARRLHVAPVKTGRGAPSLTRFDAVVVRQLGLSDVAAHVRSALARAGLRPPGYAGPEVVARWLGLRHDFPAGSDRLELYPYSRITRAEAAWSLAKVLALGSWGGDYARQTFASFSLPRYSPRQRAALRVAVSRIGYPYVWGGESDTTGGVYGPQAHGGFDCSGFVWRVFKLTGLGHGIGGRTADAMAKEIGRRARIRFRHVRGADVLFFGSPRYVSHTGIALSRSWAIHSSDQGVTIVPLSSGWLRHEFVWARRVL